MVSVRGRTSARALFGGLSLWAFGFFCLSGCQLSFRHSTTNAGSTLYHWTFDSADTASYLYPSSIDFTGGVCRLKPSDQIDDANDVLGFGGGSMNGVVWDGAGGRNYVRLSQTGTPTNTAELDPSWTPKWGNLVSYYKFNNSWNDQKGTNHFTPLNSPAFSTTSMKVGTHAAAFIGASSQYATIPSASFNFGGNFSISLWVKYSTLTPAPNTAGAETLLFESGPFQAFVRTDGLIRFVHWEPGPTPYFAWGKALVAGPWYHLVFVKNGNNVKIYENGDDATTSSATFPPFAGSASTFNLAYTPSYLNQYMTGFFDDLAVWNTDLSATDVGTLYSRQSATYSGTFTSRVMDAMATGRSWTTLSWVPTLPFLKELPDYASGAIQNEISADYSSLVGSTGSIGDNDLLTGIVGLWHLDEAAGTTGAGSVKDSSGQGRHGTPTSVGSFGVAAPLSGGAQFNGTAGQKIDLGTGLQMGKNDRTIALWFKAAPGTIGTLIADYDYYCNGFQHGIGFVAPGAIGVCYGGNWIQADIRGPTGLDDGKWHHVAVTFKRTGNVTFYTDGQAGATYNISADAATNNNTTKPMLLGNNGNNNAAFTGTLDEVGIWNRALHAKEVLQLYRRGANRIKHQVRICAASDCSDDPTGANWKGPDGTNQTYFSELNNNTVPLAMTGTVNKGLPSMIFSAFTSPVGTSQYFQYRTILESDGVGANCDYGSGPTWCSPELKSVQVDPARYDNSAPAIIGKTGVTMSQLNSFTETLGSSCAAGVGYNFSPDRTLWYYWNGTAWAIANGTATQSNPATVLSSHAQSFISQVGPGSVYFKAYLKSDGTTPCELDDLQVSGLL